MKFLSSSLFVVVAVLVLQANLSTAKGVVGCYYGIWAYYRTGNGRFTVDNINPNLCTHLYYSFMGIDEEGQVTSIDRSFDKPFNLTDGNIAKTVALKGINKDLKVLASIGGWNEGSAKFSKMVGSEETRSIFIKTVVAGVVGNKLDGVDIFWQYPGQRQGSSPDDRANFVQFLKELSAVFKPRGLLLTVSVAGDVRTAKISYDIPNIVPYVDLINVLAYDYSGPWDSTAGFNAPLQGHGGLNVQNSIDYWLKNGAPSEKLVLVIPFYGHALTLASADNNKAGAAISGAGEPGPYTKTAGTLSHSEICENLKSGWEKYWDLNSLVTYAVHGNQWVSFDGEKSIDLKIKFLQSKKLAGAAIWSLENDDFLGLCGKKYPLLNAVHCGVNN